MCVCVLLYRVILLLCHRGAGCDKTKREQSRCCSSCYFLGLTQSPGTSKLAAFVAPPSWLLLYRLFRLFFFVEVVARDPLLGVFPAGAWKKRKHVPHLLTQPTLTGSRTAGCRVSNQPGRLCRGGRCCGRGREFLGVWWAFVSTYTGWSCELSGAIV